MPEKPQRCVPLIGPGPTARVRPGADHRSSSRTRWAFRHASSKFDIPLVLSSSGPGGQIGASQPWNVVGEGLGWVEHSHTESPGITQRLLLRVGGALPMFRTPAPRRPRGDKGLAEELCAALWRAHDFGGYVPKVWLKISWLPAFGLVQGSLSQCLIPQSVWGWGAGKVCVMDASFWFFRRYFATVFLLDSPTFAVTVFARVVLRGLL